VRRARKNASHGCAHGTIWQARRMIASSCGFEQAHVVPARDPGHELLRLMRSGTRRARRYDPADTGWSKSLYLPIV